MNEETFANKAMKPFLEMVEKLYAENYIMKRMLVERYESWRDTLQHRLEEPSLQQMVRSVFDDLYRALVHDQALHNAIQDFLQKHSNDPAN